MPSVAERKAKVESQIQETRKQIQLSEGQNKAFYEEAENEKKRNRERVKHLREAIKELHFTLHDATRGSEIAVEEVIQKKKRERSGSGASSAKVTKSSQAIKLSEYRLHDHVKRLNYLQYKANEREIRFAQLQQYLEDEGPRRAKEQQDLIDQLKKNHTTLENELERILVQVTQSEAVKRRYVAMVTSLKGDAASHRTNMDIMQDKLTREREVLRSLKESRRNAERTRDDIRSVLHREEDNAFEYRRERERKLEEFKKKVEEKSVSEMSAISHRKLSILRTPTQRLSPTPANNEVTPAAKINQEMQKFAHLFSKLKDTLGVTSVEEVLDRLLAQRDTREHLHNLRDSTLKELENLRREKEHLQQELHKVKYAATEDSAKLDGAFGELETKKVALLESKEKLEEELEEDLKVLAGARATFEYMAEKLQNEDSEMPKENSGSCFEYLLSLKEFCFEESEKCLRTVKEKEWRELQEKEEKVVDLLSMSGGEKEGQPCSPSENVRVLFPVQKGTKQGGPQVDDGIDSGEEEEALARRFIKRQAQMVVEAKSRRRNRPVSTFRS